MGGKEKRGKKGDRNNNEPRAGGVRLHYRAMRSKTNKRPGLGSENKVGGGGYF